MIYVIIFFLIALLFARLKKVKLSIFFLVLAVLFASYSEDFMSKFNEQRKVIAGQTKTVNTEPLINKKIELKIPGHTVELVYSINGSYEFSDDIVKDVFSTSNIAILLMDKEAYKVQIEERLNKRLQKLGLKLDVKIVSLNIERTESVSLDEPSSKKTSETD